MFHLTLYKNDYYENLHSYTDFQTALYHARQYRKQGFEWTLESTHGNFGYAESKDIDTNKQVQNSEEFKAVKSLMTRLMDDKATQFTADLIPYHTLAMLTRYGYVILSEQQPDWTKGIFSLTKKGIQWAFANVSGFEKWWYGQGQSDHNKPVYQVVRCIEHSHNDEITGREWVTVLDRADKDTVTRTITESSNPSEFYVNEILGYEDVYGYPELGDEIQGEDWLDMVAVKQSWLDFENLSKFWAAAYAMS